MLRDGNSGKDPELEQYMREAWANMYPSGQNWSSSDPENPAVRYGS